MDLEEYDSCSRWFLFKETLRLSVFFPQQKFPIGRLASYLCQESGTTVAKTVEVATLKNIYPPVMTNIAIENGQSKSCVFPFIMVIFHSYVNVLQRVNVLHWIDPLEKKRSPKWDSGLDGWQWFKCQQRVVSSRVAPKTLCHPLLLLGWEGVLIVDNHVNQPTNKM